MKKNERKKCGRIERERDRQRETDRQTEIDRLIDRFKKRGYCERKTNVREK